MEITQLAIFGVLLNVLISIASPFLVKKFGSDQAKNIKLGIMIIIPISFGLLKVFFGDSFWQSFLMVGGVASYIYALWTKQSEDQDGIDPISRVAINVVDTFRK